MQVLWFVALFVGLGTSFSGGQQADLSAPPKPDSQPSRVKVYSVGPGVTAPELLPLNVTNISTKKCKKKVDGKVVFTVLVDETGKPRNIMFLQPLGWEVDKLALQVVTADRFKPGIHDGVPVVIGQSVEVDLQACVDENKDDAGMKTDQLRLRSQPVQNLSALPQPLEDAVLTPIGLSLEDFYKAAFPNYRIGGKVTAPVLLYSVSPEFTDEARRAKYQGVVVVSTVVDAQGMPQNVRVVRPLGMGLDEKAIAAVKKYRFKPAMRNGEPVAVMVSIEINFRLYN
jgi:TonB family protein